MFALVYLLTCIIIGVFIGLYGERRGWSLPRMLLITWALILALDCIAALALMHPDSQPLPTVKAKDA